MEQSYWNPLPLRNVILSILAKHQGMILDNELVALIEKEYGEVSQSVLNKALMDLEINGIIHVSRITKTKRRIEAIKPGAEFLPVSED
jgi:DNA-binding transcriptional ArsR family regulator